MTNRNGTPQTTLIGQLDDFEAAFDRCFGLAAFQMNRHLIDHMLRAGRELTENDYEAMLIWGVVAHQNVAHLFPPGSGPGSLLNERGRVQSKQGMRPLRLRDVTQIARLPRETVRRKLDKLAADGWIERQAEGWVIRANHSADLLRELTRENVRRFLCAAEDVLRTLKEADAVATAERVIAKTDLDSNAR